MEQKKISIRTIWLGSMCFIILMTFALVLLELFEKKQNSFSTWKEFFTPIFLAIVFISISSISVSYFYLPRIMKSISGNDFWRVFKISQIGMFSIPAVLGCSLFIVNHNSFQLIFFASLSLVTIFFLNPKNAIFQERAISDNETFENREKYLVINEQEDLDKIKFSFILLIPLFSWIMLIFLLKKPIFLLATAYGSNGLAMAYIFISASLIVTGIGGVLKLSAKGYPLLPKKILFSLCFLMMIFPIISQLLITPKNISEENLRNMLNQNQILSSNNLSQSANEIEREMRSGYCKGFISMAKSQGQKCEVDKNMSGTIFWSLIFGTIYIVLVNRYQGKRKKE